MIYTIHCTEYQTPLHTDIHNVDCQTFIYTRYRVRASPTTDTAEQSRDRCHTRFARVCSVRYTTEIFICGAGAGMGKVVDANAITPVV